MVCPMGAVRVAIAVGYLGSGYSGSQVQPNVPTVQGELEAALFRLKWCEHGTHPVTLSSRTDGGVDARMNIGSFDLPEQTLLAQRTKLQDQFDESDPSKLLHLLIC